MAVIVANRKESRFEVFHHFIKTRKEITNLLLRDFGYRHDKAIKKIEKQFFSSHCIAELSSEDQELFKKKCEKYHAFDMWYITDTRKVIMDYLREITKQITIANNIHPYLAEEYAERRIAQDKAIGACYGLLQELQYVIETLPVDVNQYTRFAQMIYKEIILIKGWRKADNKSQKSKDRE